MLSVKVSKETEILRKGQIASFLTSNCFITTLNVTAIHYATVVVSMHRKKRKKPTLLYNTAQGMLHHHRKRQSWSTPAAIKITGNSTEQLPSRAGLAEQNI